MITHKFWEIVVSIDKTNMWVAASKPTATDSTIFPTYYPEKFGGNDCRLSVRVSLFSCIIYSKSKQNTHFNILFNRPLQTSFKLKNNHGDGHRDHGQASVK